MNLPLSHAPPTHTQCGSNQTDCPPPPTYLKPANYSNIGISFRGLTGGFEKVGKWFKDTFDSGTLGTTIVVAIIVLLVIGLGALKVVLVVYTGKLNLPAVPCCTRCVCGIAAALGECLQVCLRNLKLDFLLCCTRCLPGNKGFTATGTHIGSGWVHPTHCDGTCEGAGRARREHRRLLRMHRRRSLPTPPPEVWWESPYTCTCAVRYLPFVKPHPPSFTCPSNRETVSLCEICAGTFFFFYCPLLPLWWGLGFLFQVTKKMWRRYRRRKEYQRQHTEKRRERSYLVLDKYMRGKVETIEFDGILKKRRKEGSGEGMADQNWGWGGVDPMFTVWS